MSKLVTHNLKLFNVDQFIESFSEPNYNIYYYFVGDPVPSVNDTTPPTLYDNIQTTLVDPYEKMLYGKRITSSDVTRMALRHDWVSNTVYTKYSHDRSDLYNTQFYAYVDDGSYYSVFKCLDNNGGAPSTTPPSLTETSAEDDLYFTSDGYQWKYLYSVTTSQHDKFTTADYIPVYAEANVVGNSVSGSIDNIEVVSTGNNYVAYTNGLFEAVRVGGNNLVYSIDHTSASPNTNFYKDSAVKIVSGTGAGQQRKIVGYTVSGTTRNIIIDQVFDVNPTTTSGYDISPLVTISGDGSNAVARAIVNTSSNSIYRIDITSRGSGYSYGTATLSGNTGTTNSVSSASLKLIVSPKGGHGSNAAAELGAHFVGISTVFDSSLSGDKVVDANDFRSVGILKDPLLSSSTLNITPVSGTFTVGEVISQTQGSTFTAHGIVSSSNASSVLVSNAYGFFLEGNSSVNLLVGSTSNAVAVCDSVQQINVYFDQTTRITGSLQTSQEFAEDESVVQNSNLTAYYYQSNSTVMRLVSAKGTVTSSNSEVQQYIDGVTTEAKFLVSNVAGPDIVKGSGEVLYIENFTPINKTAGQTETIKLVLEF
jgi:hypothetical protein